MHRILRLKTVYDMSKSKILEISLKTFLAHLIRIWKFFAEKILTFPEVLGIIKRVIWWRICPKIKEKTVGYNFSHSRKPRFFGPKRQIFKFNFFIFGKSKFLWMVPNDGRSMVNIALILFVHNFNCSYLNFWNLKSLFFARSGVTVWLWKSFEKSRRILIAPELAKNCSSHFL